MLNREKKARTKKTRRTVIKAPRLPLQQKILILTTIMLIFPLVISVMCYFSVQKIVEITVAEFDSTISYVEPFVPRSELQDAYKAQQRFKEMLFATSDRIAALIIFATLFGLVVSMLTSFFVSRGLSLEIADEPTVKENPSPDTLAENLEELAELVRKGRIKL